MNHPFARMKIVQLFKGGACLLNADLTARFEKLKNHTPHVLGSKTLSTYAVLLPLIKMDNEIQILFEIRAHHLRRQPGEICFPGGRIEKGVENSETAAIREASEELQIEKESINIIGPLDFLVQPYETIIYPYVGWIEKELSAISPNKSEVDKLFTVPLSYLLEAEPKVYTVQFKVQPEENFPYHLIPDGKNYNWRRRSMDEYFYFYEDKVIWGLTARILHEFIEYLK